MQHSLGLYIHIPFCRAKCSYCDFNSYPNLEGLIPGYVEALIAEVVRRTQAISENLHADTIYFGGGTPTLLPPGKIASLIRACRNFVEVPADTEITMEGNPGTVDRASLTGYLQAGVNRLSLGVQSLDDTELKALGRIHSAAQAAEAFSAARQAGFSNISLDLIYGLPGQSSQGWQAVLKKALGLDPEHLSLYALTVEEDTPMGKAIACGETPAPDSDTAADMYQLAEDLLAKAGYVHYEISNWAKPGRECRHNLIYWRNEPYIGFGAGAHSSFNSWRFSNVLAPQSYISLVARHAAIEQPEWMGSAVDTTEFIGDDLRKAQTVILGLRLVEGLALDAFAQEFGGRLESAFNAQIEDLANAGLLEVVEGRLRLTAKGRLLGNEVFQRFLPEPEVS